MKIKLFIVALQCTTKHSIDDRKFYFTWKTSKCYMKRGEVTKQYVQYDVYYIYISHSNTYT